MALLSITMGEIRLINFSTRKSTWQKRSRASFHKCEKFYRTASSQKTKIRKDHFESDGNYEKVYIVHNITYTT